MIFVKSQNNILSNMVILPSRSLKKIINVSDTSKVMHLGSRFCCFNLRRKFQSKKKGPHYIYDCIYVFSHSLADLLLSLYFRCSCEKLVAVRSHRDIDSGVTVVFNKRNK